MPGVYIRQGKYSEAEPLCQRALAIDEKALGPNHPNVATNLNNLAELYRAQGKYSEAESLYQRALAIDESIGAESMDLPLPHKREFEVVIMIESATGEMVGTDRNTARKITREPWYRLWHGLIQLERNGALLRVHTVVRPQRPLTEPTLLEMDV